MKRYIGSGEVKIFTHVGEQINDVTRKFREIAASFSAELKNEKPKVGMQLWFETPAFLVNMFRRANPMVELVSSDPIMDKLRQIKDPDEIKLMKEAQRIAALGMDRARELLRPGARSIEIAAEAVYTMMKEGAEKTSTPIHVTFGPDTCMLHGRLSEKELQAGDLIVIDLTPEFEGYCANLARTFVLGRPNKDQQKLLDAYQAMIESTREKMRPGVKMQELDAAGKNVCAKFGLDKYHIDGISHGIGLRFEETPAPTILRQHRNVEIREGMTLTIGHTILAVPQLGGVRHEDIYRVTSKGPQILFDYPINPIITI